jgi:hypothetical protein
MLEKIKKNAENDRKRCIKNRWWDGLSLNHKKFKRCKNCDEKSCKIRYKSAKAYSWKSRKLHRPWRFFWLRFKLKTN